MHTEAAMAFQVSKTSHNSRTKHYFANPRIKSKKTWLEAYRNSYLHFIGSLSSCSSLHTHTHTQTHYRIPRLRMRTKAYSIAQRIHRTKDSLIGWPIISGVHECTPDIHIKIISQLTMWTQQKCACTMYLYSQQDIWTMDIISSHRKLGHAYYYALLSN